MGIVSTGVFANAVINITGNLSGLRSAMRETQTQLWGMMTLANRFGGVMTQNILSPFAAYKGMKSVSAAQAAAGMAYQNAVGQWQGGKPIMPTAPNQMMRLWNPQLYQQLLAQHQQAMAAFPGQMAAWKQAKPNRQQFVQQFVQGAALAEGKALLAQAAFFGLAGTLATAAKYASDFREEVNKMVQTFGVSTDRVMAKVESLAGLGINRTQFMSSVSSMGIEMLGAGISEQLASEMSYALGRRAVDVSSLYNIDQDDAVRKFQSGLAGFGRPLKELGVIITESRVEAYAFARGLWDGKTEMTEYTKVMARFGLIMQETRRAQGDYAKTSLELANQFRALEGNFTNMMAAIGDMAPIQGAVFAINLLMKAIGGLAGGVTWLYEQYKRLIGTPGEMDANMQKWEASNQNVEAESRAFADNVIAENFLGKGKHASHTGLAEFGKRLQEQVFNDTGKQQLDLTLRLVGLTEEQIKLMRQLGFKNIVPPDFVPF